MLGRREKGIFTFLPAPLCTNYNGLYNNVDIVGGCDFKEYNNMNNNLCYLHYYTYVYVYIVIKPKTIIIAHM